MASRAYQFGDWRVEPDQNRIVRGEIERRLEPLCIDVLTYLLEHPKETISSDRLLEVVWGNRYVEPNAVQRVLNQIRKALGDNPKNPTYIQTVRKRGYRTLAKVRRATPQMGDDSDQADIRAAGVRKADPPHHSRWRFLVAAASLVCIGISVGIAWWWQRNAEESSAMPISSVAVPPLMGIGLPADSQWLTHGIASELTNMLATIPALRVTSQAQAFSHSVGSAASAGAAMGVDGLLLGSLHATADGLEVRMELIRTSDGEVVWREVFRGSMDDPLKLQRSLAGRIFKYFGESVSDYGSMHPTTAAAHVANLKRLAQWLTGNTEEERRWAEMTVVLEPTYAMGHVNLVWPYLYGAIDDPAGPWKSKVREALDTADDLGISHTAPFKAHEGLYHWVFEGDLDRAEALLRQAFIAGDTYGRIYYMRLVSSSGLHEPSLRMLKRLTVFDPQVSLHWELLAQHLAYSGDYAGAIEAFERALTLTGEQDFSVVEKLVLAHLARGNVSAARSAMDRLRKTAVPDWRLKSLEAWFRSRSAPDSTDPVQLATSLSAEQAHWPEVLLLLSSGEPHAEQFLADRQAEVLESPQWSRYWVDDIEWAMSPDDRRSATWKTFRHALGYTDEWRLELCRRIAKLPSETHLSCDPQEYGVDRHQGTE